MNVRPASDAATPPAPESSELSDADRKFVAECEAAYEANPSELYTWDEVVAYIKEKNRLRCGMVGRMEDQR